MLRLLILVNGLYTKKITTGGEYHILRVASSWGGENQISFIMPKLGYKSTIEIANVRSFYFSSQEIKESEGFAKLVALYLVRILRSLFFRFNDKPDVIIASSHFLYDVLPSVVLRRRLKSNLVVYVHHVLRSFRSYRSGVWSNISLLNEKLGLFLSKKAADLVFVMNKDIKNTLIEMGFQEKKIFVTGNGVEHALIDSIMVDGKKYDGCFCGRLFRTKGIYDLPEIWKIVMSHFPLSSLIIIGQGPEYDNLLNLVKKSSLEKNITLTGYLSEKEKISKVKSSKLFISPSYEEGWGITASEAMTCGLPVVCYDLPAYEIFCGGTVRVQVGNKKAMANAIIDLFRNERRQADLADKAKEATKMLDWSNIAIDELNAINNILTIRP
jgi:glycosyltransferase involved in cell wall biosynthesis